MTALVTTAERKNRSKCPRTEEWIKEMWKNVTLFCLKEKGKFLIHATTWRSLEARRLAKEASHKGTSTA
jgi:hypothetical protein